MTENDRLKTEINRLRRILRDALLVLDPDSKEAEQVAQDILSEDLPSLESQLRSAVSIALHEENVDRTSALAVLGAFDAVLYRKDD